MVEPRVFRWANGSFVGEDWCDPHVGAVRVADSFLVVDGSAIALEHHVARFVRSVSLVANDLDTQRFCEDALTLIPNEGRWFPRLEASDFGDGLIVRVLVREAPELETTVTLGTAPRDPRRTPHTKGPDLAALGALRRELNCGEAIILDNGSIAEGAWSSVVWWKDDTLHVVHPDIPRLDGVTERVIRAHATRIGSPIVESVSSPDDLDGCEVWVLSALHGIRVATEWRGGPAVVCEPGRAEYWRQQYENRRTTLTA